MWWERKPRSITPQRAQPLSPPPATPKMEKHMIETMPRASGPLASSPNQSLLGQSVVLRGDLSGKEDLLIDGHFEGTISLQEHCVTVGPHGQVKGEIHARQVVVQGTMNGNVTAREKIEIRKAGEVVGDLVAAGIAIEDGAYFKGSIDVLRESSKDASRPLPQPSADQASV